MPHRPRSRYAATCLLAALVSTACVGAADNSRAADSTTTTIATTTRPLERDSFDRAAREVTLRIRNTSCVELATGSGVSLGDGKVVTNHHVVDGADTLELSTWDGRDISATVASATTINDLAVIQIPTTNLPDPEIRTTKVRDGEAIHVVGYPKGGALRIDDGTVVDYTGGRQFEERGSILRADVRIEPGNSGGPALDDRGRLVGIVFAEEVATGYALIVPVTSLLAIPDGDFAPVDGTCR